MTNDLKSFIHVNDHTLIGALVMLKDNQSDVEELFREIIRLAILSRIYGGDPELTCDLFKIAGDAQRFLRGEHFGLGMPTSVVIDAFESRLNQQRLQVRDLMALQNSSINSNSMEFAVDVTLALIYADELSVMIAEARLIAIESYQKLRRILKEAEQGRENWQEEFNALAIEEEKQRLQVGSLMREQRLALRKPAGLTYDIFD